MINNDNTVVIKGLKIITRSETYIVITITWDQVWPTVRIPCF